MNNWTKTYRMFPPVAALPITDEVWQAQQRFNFRIVRANQQFTWVISLDGKNTPSRHYTHTVVNDWQQIS